MSPALQGRFFNHWTTREVSISALFQRDEEGFPRPCSAQDSALSLLGPSFNLLIGEWGPKISQAQFIIIFLQQQPQKQMKVMRFHLVRQKTRKFFFFLRQENLSTKLFSARLGLLPTLQCMFCICTNHTSLGDKLPSLSCKGPDDPRLLLTLLMQIWIV